MTHGRDAELRERYVSGVRTEVAIARTRSDVAAAHAELVSAGAIHAAGGAVSGRIPGADLFVVTPAGIRVQDVAPENLVLCDFDGAVIAGTPGSKGRPHGQARLHGHVYAFSSAIGGIVSSAAPYTSAWAARGESIPCALATIAEEFGGPVPLVPEAGSDEDAGRALTDALLGGRAPVAILPARGAIAVGSNVDDAARVASFTEEVARIVHLARDHGAVLALPQDEIERLYESHRAPTPEPADRGAPATHSHTSRSTTEERSKTKTSTSR
ncbi:class II aldolase/adducin family protein [Microbacterium trichothecenolyticum]|uniref:class II aldolase/adducin family protein n=1 Tax=Microbacterium trichothecenolyticum TaxID=69370 RepID=UPI001C6DDAF5|nr:class II aldolase/adducin family protein [Microbacterium trichothecenolyticum]MBW9120352.1 class II aldolase/adducin family protein [Microbacterium trichothecenolyticum]